MSTKENISVKTSVKTEFKFFKKPKNVLTKFIKLKNFYPNCFVIKDFHLL